MRFNACGRPLAGHVEPIEAGELLARARGERLAGRHPPLARAAPRPGHRPKVSGVATSVMRSAEVSPGKDGSSFARTASATACFALP
jgi:hypothetical protein